MEKQYLKKSSRVLGLLLLMSVLPAFGAYAQSKISGTVYEVDGAKRVPLSGAAIALPEVAIGTISGIDGDYSLSNVPDGKMRLKISFIGKVPVDTIINVKGNMHLDFTLLNEDFHLKEVTVTATSSKVGQSTASQISRSAMDHLQATSLYDVMSLIPGGSAHNQNLNSSQTLTIRQVGSRLEADDNSRSSAADAMNAMGTAIIRDGAPISNESNLSAAHVTAINGSSGSVPVAIGGGSAPGNGVDIRTVSTDNIESVQVIRGIPSVEYGDLTSGAVIINTKAGREPLRVTAKANPNVYQAGFGTGFELGGNRGAMNINGDYAYNTNNPVSKYAHYQRGTARLMYSNTIGNVRSNTSLDFYYGKDSRDANPDDERSQTASSGRDIGLTFNTNGTWNINRGWLKSIRYVLSGTYTDKQSWYEDIASNASGPYSMTTTNGAVLGGVAGQHIYDADGNAITNFGPEDANHYAAFLPASYFYHYDIDSREVNVFGKLTASFFKSSGYLHNGILLGADFRSNGNVGEGKTFDPSAPPFLSKGLSNNSTYRPRAYKDVPFIHNIGAYIEDNFRYSIGGMNDLTITAGVRYDHASVVGGIATPRINASLYIVPDRLSIHGGYGVAAKMPSLIYLYPENAYFDYVNMNELSDDNRAEEDRMFITTTEVHKVDNSDLKIARNHKSEVGFSWQFGKSYLNVTGYHERLKNGYMLEQTFETFNTFEWNKYTRDENDNIVLDYSAPVLSTYAKPTNNLNVENKGVELEFNLGRIDAINTAFQLSGAWMKTKRWVDGYTFYDNSSGEPSARKPIAVYERKGDEEHFREVSTTLRVIHNIPSIGFVVSLTGQVTWNSADWSKFGQDSIPVGYINPSDAKFVKFDTPFTTTQEVKDAGYGYMLQSKSHSKAIRESYGPYYVINMNLTKEVGDILRVSFFANNMFRSYPRAESKRSKGTYHVFDNRFYFGVELSLTI